jgi:hypothetical protein
MPPYSFFHRQAILAIRHVEKSLARSLQEELILPVHD